ncbi:hypothetical protein GM415_10430 [Pseudodesulfovibrio cashew]|uniref:Uncharacterized protein n=1 Tax=Pseudodesulfovibrio cashew TaxID=2678688 RepID=A0A6I6JJI5_9BACT|nr:hypothetical protein [Pseudodesulfovibrio cashew]QGY40523.1 hypothetical protein GM415_10430 [Pseudodesulfovibrio cashew]
MHRNERTPFFRLLGAIHAQRRVPRLSTAWQDAVIREISASYRPPVSELLRLAPRFTYAAATLAVVCAVAAGPVLNGLSNELHSLYANHVYALNPLSFLNL